MPYIKPERRKPVLKEGPKTAGELNNVICVKVKNIMKKGYASINAVANAFKRVQWKWIYAAETGDTAALQRFLNFEDFGLMKITSNYYKERTDNLSCDRARCQEQAYEDIIGALEEALGELRWRVTRKVENNAIKKNGDIF